MNIPTDCPQRERRGWMGDAQLSAETTIHNWDMAQGCPSYNSSTHSASVAYTKFLLDIQDSQRFENKGGQLPDCVPYYGHGSIPSDPAWGTAYTLIYNWFYKYFGDVRILTEHYSTVKQVRDSHELLEPNRTIVHRQPHSSDRPELPSAEILAVWRLVFCRRWPLQLQL